jgi:hypothetical protein
MFIDEIRRALEATPRSELARVGEAVWKAWGQGLLGDDEAQGLAERIEARRALPAPERPRRAFVGSRPRTSASMERRRSWAAAGRLPPAIAARFTLAEAAVLAVVASEISKRGACRLPLEHLAALAGVCRSTAKRALRAAHGLGLLRVEERRLTGWRNDTNVVTIVSPEWLSWLRLGPKGGGVQSVPRTHTNLRSRLAPEGESMPRGAVSAAARARNRRA